MYHLIVVHEFGNYTKGQKITDEAEVAAVLASHNHTGVVKIPAPVTEPPPRVEAEPEPDHL